MSKPKSKEFDEKLKEFTRLENDLKRIESARQIGPLSIKTKKVKENLKQWISTWKVAHLKNLQSKVKSNSFIGSYSENTNLIKVMQNDVNQKLSEPLLDDDGNEIQKGKELFEGTCPYENTWWISRCFFNWVKPLVHFAKREGKLR